MWRQRLLSLLGLTTVVVAYVALVALLHAAPPPAGNGIQPLAWAPQADGQLAAEFSADATQPLALYLESLGGGARIAVNGQPLQQHLGGTAPVTVGAAMPLLLPLPAALLQRGDNRLTVALESGLAGSHFIGDGAIGPEAQLAPRYAQRHFLRHTLLVALIVAAFVLACVSFTLWLRRPQERIYAWNALACFTGAGYSVLPISHLLPPAPWADALMMVLYLWFVLAAAWLGLCLASTPQPRTQRIITVAAFGGSVVILTIAALTDAAQFREWLRWIYAAIILIGTYTTATVFWRQYLTRWDRTSFWMLAAVMCICMVSLRDGAMLFGWIGPQDGLWLAYGSPPPMIVFTSILLRHFVRALAESELLNRELQQRVAERERLFGDLHDGLGGTLMATLSRLSNEGAANSPAAHGVQAALQDLRLTLASLDPDARSLRAALLPLRERLDAACADAGMELSFDLGGIADDFELSKSQTLHLLRIVQEAGMNAVRHAGGRQLRIAMAVTGNSLEVRIEDDGIGIRIADAERPGHYGLASLRRRAQQLGGRIDWLAQPSGTCVQLIVPLSPPQ